MESKFLEYFPITLAYMIPGEVDQYRNVTVGSCILAQPAIWSLICVTDTFLRTTNLCRRGTFSRDNIISRHLTLSCPPPCVSPVQVHLCHTVSHFVTPIQVHLCHTVSLPSKSICVTLCHSRPSPSVSHCVTPAQVHLCPPAEIRQRFHLPAKKISSGKDATDNFALAFSSAQCHFQYI